MRARLSTTFQSLTVPNYRLFATGWLIKSIGGWMMYIAQDWLVLELSGDSATALGVVTALQFTPFLLFTLLAGRLADRYDKRLLLVIANVGWAAFSVVMSVLVLIGAVRLWHVFVFALLLGVCHALETPVRQSFISELVGAKLLPNAIALGAATFNTARIVGPAVAGIGIALFDVGPMFLISALGAVVALWLIIRIRVTELHRDALPPVGERDTARIVDGIRYVRRRPDLMLPMFLVAVIGMALFNFPLTLAALAKTVFQTGAASFGLFTTALATGALAGALAGGSRRERPSPYLALVAAFALGGFGVLVGIAPAFWLVVTLLVPTGFFMVFFAQACNHRIQLSTDAAFRGRVMALWVLLFLGTNPIAAPVIGWVAERFGAGASIWLGGVFALAAATIGLVWQLRHTSSRLSVRLRPRVRLRVVPIGGAPAAAVAGASAERA